MGLQYSTHEDTDGLENGAVVQRSNRAKGWGSCLEEEEGLQGGAVL